MGERAAGHEVDAQVGDGLHVVRVDVAGAFGLRASVDERDGRRHGVVVHVVEHDDVGSGGNRLLDLRERLALHLDLAYEGGVGARRLDSLAHAARGGDVVVLQQHPVGEVVAVVAPAAAPDGLLLEHAHVRRGLARVHQLGAAALEQRGNAVRVGGDAAHALQVVQGHALARQQHAHIAGHRCKRLACANVVAVCGQALNARFGVKDGECALEHVKAAQHAIGLRDKVHSGGARVGHDGGSGHVLVGDVLGQRLADERLGHGCQRDGVHAQTTSLELAVRSVSDGEGFCGQVCGSPCAAPSCVLRSASVQRRW